MADEHGFDEVNRPRHYNTHPSGIECIDVVRNLGFDLGNAVKYVWRAWLKNGRQDLEKAEYYLRDLVAREIPGGAAVPEISRELLLRAANAEDSQPGPVAAIRAGYFRAVARQHPQEALQHLVDLMETVDNEEIS